MTERPALDGLSHQEKDARIRGLWKQLRTGGKLPQKPVKQTLKHSRVPPIAGIYDASNADCLDASGQQKGDLAALQSADRRSGV
jgi:hypothetical protein